MTSPTRVAYLVRRFPKVNETYILGEIIAVSRRGVPIDLYALRRGDAVGVPDAAPFLDRLHVWPFLSADILRANVRSWRQAPETYAQTLRDLVRGTWGSRRIRSALRFFLRSVRMAADMSARGVTHVHAHFAGSPAACAFVIHRLTGIPYSFTAHGADIHQDRAMLPEKVAEARFVVAVSRFNRDVILEACQGRFREKVAVIHCGVDLDRFSPARQEGADGPARGPEPFRVVCVGRLHAVKGQRFLIEACRLLTARGVAVECHLVGDGPDRAGSRGARPGLRASRARALSRLADARRSGRPSSGPRTSPPPRARPPRGAARGHPGGAHGSDGDGRARGGEPPRGHPRARR